MHLKANVEYISSIGCHIIYITPLENVYIHFINTIYRMTDISSGGNMKISRTKYLAGGLFVLSHAIDLTKILTHIYLITDSAGERNKKRKLKKIRC